MPAPLEQYPGEQQVRRRGADVHADGDEFQSVVLEDRALDALVVDAAQPLVVFVGEAEFIVHRPTSLTLASALPALLV